MGEDGPSAPLRAHSRTRGTVTATAPRSRGLRSRDGAGYHLTPEAAALAEEFDKAAMLLAATEDWEGRLAGLKKVTELLRSGSGELDAFLPLLREKKVAQYLAGQLGDLRSEITKEACACLTALAQACCGRPTFGVLLLEVFMGPLLKLVAMPHRVMSDNGHLAALAVFSCVQMYKFIPRITEALFDKKVVALRIRCSEYLLKVVTEWSPDVVGKELDAVEAAIAKGIADASQEVRRTCKQCYQALEAGWPLRAEKLLARLDPAGQKLIMTEQPPPSPASRVLSSPGRVNAVSAFAPRGLRTPSREVSASDGAAGGSIATPATPPVPAASSRRRPTPRTYSRDRATGAEEPSTSESSESTGRYSDAAPGPSANGVRGPSPRYPFTRRATAGPAAEDAAPSQKTAPATYAESARADAASEASAAIGRSVSDPSSAFSAADMNGAANSSTHPPPGSGSRGRASPSLRRYLSQTPHSPAAARLQPTPPPARAIAAAAAADGGGGGSQYTELSAPGDAASGANGEQGEGQQPAAPRAAVLARRYNARNRTPTPDMSAAAAVASSADSVDSAAVAAAAAAAYGAAAAPPSASAEAYSEQRQSSATAVPQTPTGSGTPNTTQRQPSRGSQSVRRYLAYNPRRAASTNADFAQNQHTSSAVGLEGTSRGTDGGVPGMPAEASAGSAAAAALAAAAPAAPAAAAAADASLQPARPASLPAPARAPSQPAQAPAQAPAARPADAAAAVVGGSGLERRVSGGDAETSGRPAGAAEPHPPPPGSSRNSLSARRRNRLLSTATVTSADAPLMAFKRTSGGGAGAPAGNGSVAALSASGNALLPTALLSNGASSTPPLSHAAHQLPVRVGSQPAAAAQSQSLSPHAPGGNGTAAFLASGTMVSGSGYAHAHASAGSAGSYSASSAGRHTATYSNGNGSAGTAQYGHFPMPEEIAEKDIMNTLAQLDALMISIKERNDKHGDKHGGSVPDYQKRPSANDYVSASSSGGAGMAHGHAHAGLHTSSAAAAGAAAATAAATAAAAAAASVGRPAHSGHGNGNNGYVTSYASAATAAGAAAGFALPSPVTGLGGRGAANVRDPKQLLSPETLVLLGLPTVA